MFASNVQPKKRPLREKPAAWECKQCRRHVPGFWARCPNCHTASVEGGRASEAEQDR